MSLRKRYHPQTREREIVQQWQEAGTHAFHQEDERPVYSIDTPPPTVSGFLHLGHVYSYSHTDFIARFWRMNGYNVFYPMGFDDNGLPTERLVERTEGVRATEIGRRAFIEKCLAVSSEAEEAYKELWQRLGLSIDWRYTYRTIDEPSRRISQWSFIDLYRKNLVYRQKAPTIWCPECQTAIAQAEVNNLERDSVFYTLAFTRDDGAELPIATTRPELLPACVAIFIHPEHPQGVELAGRTATTPLFGKAVPILLDPAADPEKGTGIVMCCTFGDTVDVEWWRTHQLPLIEAIGKDGRMLIPADDFAGLTIAEARKQIVQALANEGQLLAQEPIVQSVRVHERCDTPVEFVITSQWFISVLPYKESLLEAGERVTWHPEHMKVRYRQWVEHLAWDWCISRQRYFGVMFPLWYCDTCGEIILADEQALPVDPTETSPPNPCRNCGGTSFTPETDVMDTWATSSLTPQIVGEIFQNPDLYRSVFPFSLRPQAHEIIRTWAFYTIVKSQYHFDAVPWRDVAISGWGLAPEGAAKLSKSRGNAAIEPLAMIEQYSADAVRYWAASTGFGKDSVIDEQKIQAGAKVITKLWNVARFSQRFLARYQPEQHQTLPVLTLADRWLLSRLQGLIQRITHLLQKYDYATAKSEIELFFWTELADNYLEMAKKRLYDGGEMAEGATFTLYHAIHTMLKLLAPFLPFVTEAIYQGLFETAKSIHSSTWPTVQESLLDPSAERHGPTLLEIAAAVRRFKSETKLSLSAPLDQLLVVTDNPELAHALQAGSPDLASVTRAEHVAIYRERPAGLEPIWTNGEVEISLGYN